MTPPRRRTRGTLLIGLGRRSPRTLTTRSWRAVGTGGGTAAGARAGRGVEIARGGGGRRRGRVGRRGRLRGGMGRAGRRPHGRGGRACLPLGRDRGRLRTGLGARGGEASLVDALEHLSGQVLQRREDALAPRCDGLEVGESPRVDLPFEVLDGHRVIEVALVVLDDDRHVLDGLAHLLEVLLQVLERFLVLLELGFAGVRDEDDAVDTLQHEATRRLVVDLSRHGVELELRADARDLAEVERHVVEVQRPLTRRRDGGEFASRVGRHLAVHELQVGRLPGHSRSVVDDLALDLLLREVDLDHR
jgi:hypothetical protein